jgi:hypothetical protein
LYSDNGYKYRFCLFFSTFSGYEDEGDISMPVRRDPSGNEYILDDFPCSGPAFVDRLDDDKNIVAWTMTERSVVVRDLTYYIYCRNVASWFRS